MGEKQRLAMAAVLSPAELRDLDDARQYRQAWSAGYTSCANRKIRALFSHRRSWSSTTTLCSRAQRWAWDGTFATKRGREKTAGTLVFDEAMEKVAADESHQVS